jgi:D-amino-acid oxidase
MRITVVGAGVSGLTSALSLQERGHDVRIVAASTSAQSTSFLAAAVWFPTHVGPPDRVAGWGRTTYEDLAGQAQHQVPGVLMRESLALYRNPPGRPDWIAAVGEVRAATDSELPTGYGHGLRFAVPLVEMPLYLPWLVTEFEGRGGTLEPFHVTGLDQLADADVVVNCAGLAAGELVGDASVYPVRGQIVRVSNPGLTLSVRDENHPGGRAYVHPRTQDCILGGTLDEHNWSTDVDPGEAKAILARCRDIVPELADATVLEHIVGLRPGRPTVRLEEDAPIGSTRVVHNYGHGGSGITLSWGCAREVAELVG